MPSRLGKARIKIRRKNVCGLMPFSFSPPFCRFARRFIKRNGIIFMCFYGCLQCSRSSCRALQHLPSAYNSISRIPILLSWWSSCRCGGAKITLIDGRCGNTRLLVFYRTALLNGNLSVNPIITTERHTLLNKPEEYINSFRPYLFEFVFGERSVCDWI